jgi:hypothetical protein
MTVCPSDDHFAFKTMDRRFLVAGSAWRIPLSACCLFASDCFQMENVVVEYWTAFGFFISEKENFGKSVTF